MRQRFRRQRAAFPLTAGAAEAGQLVRARLARDAGVSETSATTCVDALQALYLVTALPPGTANLTKRSVGRAKGVLADSGLAARLGRRLIAGIVLTASDHAHKFGDRLWGLPAAYLWQ
jgi:predicted AAA+ superfamily ATPase